MTAYHFRTRENGSCFEETEVNVSQASVGGSGGAKLAVFVSENQRAEVRETDYARQFTGGGGKAGQGYPAARIGNAVRRLTPTECCRLQGFPDDWLGTPNEKPDSQRYAALGDAVTVNVAEWVGRRILEAAA